MTSISREQIEKAYEEGVEAVIALIEGFAKEIREGSVTKLLNQ